MWFKLGLFLVTVSAAAQTSWISFQDPIEHAFTLDVPKGWSAKGGLFRMGYSDARPMVDIQSPDGRIDVRLRDVSIPSYFVPNQFHPREGEIYDLGAQAQLTVARYRSGQEYAALYAQARFKSVCQNLLPQPTNTPMPMKDAPSQDVPPVQSSPGQVSYRCESAQGARIAYVFARTSLYEGFWQVQALASLIAPADQLALSRAVLLRAADSFQISPQWTQYQKRMDQEALDYQRARQQGRLRQLNQQVAQFEMKMQSMKTQVNAFERQQARQSAQVEDFGNILTGITPTIDPLGNRRDVWTGTKSRYWTNGTGVVINSDDPPGGGWQQMQVRK
jgi:outer membrane murein-binding lipoprotein Lpp